MALKQMILTHGSQLLSWPMTVERIGGLPRISVMRPAKKIWVGSKEDEKR